MIAPAPGQRVECRTSLVGRLTHIVASYSFYDRDDREYCVTADVGLDGYVSLWGREDGLGLDDLAAVVGVDPGWITDELRRVALGDLDR